MGLLSWIFCCFLGVIACVGCTRMAKLIIKAINGIFDRIEDKLC